MSCDKLVFDLSQEIEGSPVVFVQKSWLSILDNQNQQYGSNQSVIDTSQLANSNKYMSYRESYLAMPLLLTLVATTPSADFTPATANSDYAVSLKSWFGTMIHSFTLDMQGTTIIQQTPYINMWNSFKLLTSLSWEDVATQGSTIGFYPDDPLTWAIQTAPSLAGVGICNNNFATVVPVASGNQTAAGLGSGATYRSGLGNVGATMRAYNVAYDPTSVIGNQPYSTLLSASSTSQIWKSFVSTKIDGTGAVNGCLQISIMATIYLKHIHSFFSMVPLLKGIFLKMTMNLNNSTTTFSVGAGPNAPISLVSVANSVGGVNPILVSSTAATTDYAGSIAFGGASNLGELIYNANISVGSRIIDSATAQYAGALASGKVASSVYLYVPAYTFNPPFEQSYLSSPIKQIKYTDVYQYQVLGVNAGLPFNNLITNGISNIKSILIVPFFSASNANGAQATGLPAGVPVYQSPFDTAGTGTTSPLIHFNNFNCVVSGQNAIYNTQRYAFEQFNNQLYGASSVNGGMTDGLTSGLIDRLGFDMAYCYYYVNVERMLPVEQSVPKSVQIIGTNQSQRAVDMWVFIEYGVDISIDILSGARV